MERLLGTLEFISLLVFFVVNKYSNIYLATLSLVIFASLSFVIMIITKKYDKRIIFTNSLLIVFGSLTVFMHTPYFIQIKFTITYLLFAAIMLFSILFNKNPLKAMLQSEKTGLHMEEKYWRKSMYLWLIFFLLMAILNEIVRHIFSVETWVNFKVFGASLLTLVVFLIQFIFIFKGNKKS